MRQELKDRCLNKSRNEPFKYRTINSAGQKNLFSPVRELVGLLKRTGTGGSLHFLFEVEGDVTEFLLDVPDDFPLSGGGERVASLGQNLHQVIGQITSSQVQTKNCVGQSIA